MNIPWNDLGTLATAALSTGAAFGSWRAARQSNRTADAVARIERERWHADLTPQFRITIGEVRGDRATLDVQLTGPLSLRRLDEIAVAVVPSDDLDRTPRLAGSVSQEEVDAQVWGPFRFRPGADGADPTGHSVAPFALRVGQGRPFAAERTRPPHWEEGEDLVGQWRRRWAGRPMRLVLTCRRAGDDVWVVPYDVEVPQSAQVAFV